MAFSFGATPAPAPTATAASTTGQSGGGLFGSSASAAPAPNTTGGLFGSGEIEQSLRHFRGLLCLPIHISD